MDKLNPSQTADFQSDSPFYIPASSLWGIEFIHVFTSICCSIFILAIIAASIQGSCVKDTHDLSISYNCMWIYSFLKIKNVIKKK